MPSTDLPKRPREGTRVIWEPNAASAMLYSYRQMLPKEGELGTIKSMSVPGAGRTTAIPGPGGGLVYVKWDNGEFFGVSRYDIRKAPKGKEAIDKHIGVHIVNANGYRGMDFLVDIRIMSTKVSQASHDTIRGRGALMKKAYLFGEDCERTLNSYLKSGRASVTTYAVNHKKGTIEVEVGLKEVAVSEDARLAASRLSTKLRTLLHDKIDRSKLSSEETEAAGKTARPQEISYTGYQIDELKGSNKDHAIEKIRAILHESGFINEDIKESFTYELKKLHYPTDDIQWGLGHVQGDGVAFYGRIDRDDIKKVARRVMGASWVTKFEKFAQRKFNIWSHLEVQIKSLSHRYAHYNTMSVELDGGDIEREMEYVAERKGESYSDKIEDMNKMIDQLEEGIQEDVKKVSKKLEKEGYSIIDSQTDDDAAIDFAQANDYLFDEDGNFLPRRRR